MGRWSLLVVVLAVLFSARFAVVGADTYWAVALGRIVAGRRSVPDGIPFAEVPSAGWPNVPVLGELVLAAAASPGPVGLVALQLVVDAVALTVLAAGARRLGASDGATAVTLALVAVGSLPALVVVRMQLFSLALLPLVLALLRADHAKPSPRVWWVVPLLGVWGNLHGGVLVGLGVTGSYLVASRLRRRPAETVALGIAAVLALAANPAGVRTAAYYAGALGNEAARRGAELWARPDLGSPFDVLLVAAGLVLVGLAALSRRRPPAWEALALAGLVLAAATSARHGVWLLVLAAGPAARALTGLAGARAEPRRGGRGAQAPRAARPAAARPAATVAPRPAAGPAATVAARPAAAVAFRPAARVVATLLLAAGSAVLVATRADELNPSGSAALLAAVRQEAGGDVVLADEPVAESLAAEGVRVWMSNPLDAFPKAAQGAYLDFVDGRPGAALDAATHVVVRSGSPPDTLVAGDPRFAARRAVAGWSLYARVR